MVKTISAKSKWLQALVCLWGIGMVAGLIVVQSTISEFKIFDFRFNGYAMISLATVLVNLSFVGYIIKKRNEFKSDEVTWYLLFLYSMILFGFFEMLQRLSANPSAAIFWAALSGIGPAFLGVGLLLFTLQFTKPDVKLSNTIPIALISGAILFFFFGSGNTVFLNTLQATKLYPWGYNNDIGKAFVLDFSWGLGLAIVAIVVMARFRSRTRNLILKKQAMLFVVALAVPVAGALFFNSLAPIIGLKTPPVADTFTVLTAGLMLYGLSHYRLFKVTPASMSSYVLSTMTESVIVTDDKLQIQLTNDAANGLFKSFKIDNVNRSLLDFFKEDEAKRMMQEIGKITSVGNKHIMGNFVYNNDIFLRITAIKITEEHGVNGYIFAITDITELQKSYQALEKEKNSVEQKVEDRTRELRIAQQRLAETDKIKTEFVILTSHNLRTPLTKIKGNLEFISGTKLNTDQKQYVSGLETNTEKLSSLVEELLTISEIEAGDKSSLKPTPIKDIVEVLSDEAQELAKQSGNKYEVINTAKDLKIKANPARLTTALHNLLENAFKFTKNGSVSLEITKNNSKLLITVRDTGIGISADEQSKLFTKFHRGTDYMKYEYEGEGIGLYLTKLIVDEHKGNISVVSQEGQGTAITVTLPID
ncbi:MAG: ATP-binding protein [Candidatus Saccharimonadales bacterium]